MQIISVWLSGHAAWLRSAHVGGYFACSQPTGDAGSYCGCRVRPPGGRCACSGRARRPVCPGSGLIHPACMRVSWPAELRDGSAGQRLVQRRLGRSAVRQAAQMVLDGVGREALLDVAADAGTRVLALGQLALAVAFGLQRGADRDLRSAILRSCRWLGGIDPRPGGAARGGRPSLFSACGCRRGRGRRSRGRRRPGGCRRCGAGLRQRGCGDRPGGAALQPG